MALIPEDRLQKITGYFGRMKHMAELFGDKVPKNLKELNQIAFLNDNQFHKLINNFGQTRNYTEAIEKVFAGETKAAATELINKSDVYKDVKRKVEQVAGRDKPVDNRKAPNPNRPTIEVDTPNRPLGTTYPEQPAPAATTKAERAAAAKENLTARINNLDLDDPRRVQQRLKTLKNNELPLEVESTSPVRQQGVNNEVRSLDELRDAQTTRQVEASSIKGKTKTFLSNAVDKLTAPPVHASELEAFNNSFDPAQARILSPEELQAKIDNRNPPKLTKPYTIHDVANDLGPEPKPTGATRISDSSHGTWRTSAEKEALLKMQADRRAAGGLPVNNGDLSTPRIDRSNRGVTTPTINDARNPQFTGRPDPDIRSHGVPNNPNVTGGSDFIPDPEGGVSRPVDVVDQVTGNPQQEIHFEKNNPPNAAAADGPPTGTGKDRFMGKIFGKNIPGESWWQKGTRAIGNLGKNVFKGTVGTGLDMTKGAIGSIGDLASTGGRAVGDLVRPVAKYAPALDVGLTGLNVWQEAYDQDRPDNNISVGGGINKRVRKAIGIDPREESNVATPWQDAGDRAVGHISNILGVDGTASDWLVDKATDMFRGEEEAKINSDLATPTHIPTDTSSKMNQIIRDAAGRPSQYNNVNVDNSANSDGFIHPTEQVTNTDDPNAQATTYNPNKQTIRSVTGKSNLNDAINKSNQEGVGVIRAEKNLDGTDPTSFTADSVMLDTRGKKPFTGNQMQSLTPREIAKANSLFEQDKYKDYTPLGRGIALTRAAKSRRADRELDNDERTTTASIRTAAAAAAASQATRTAAEREDQREAVNTYYHKDTTKDHKASIVRTLFNQGVQGGDTSGLEAIIMQGVQDASGRGWWDTIRDYIPWVNGEPDVPLHMKDLMLSDDFWSGMNIGVEGGNIDQSDIQNEATRAYIKWRTRALNK